MSPRVSGFLPVVRRWWALLLVGGCLAGIAGYVVVSQQKPSYQARVELLVGPINTNFETLKASGQLAQSYAQLASSNRVLQATIAQLQLPLTPAKLEKSVKATANTVTRVLTIRVQGDEPQVAANIANTLASKLGTLATVGTAPPVAGQLRVIDPAEAGTPVQPKKGVVVAVAVLVGLFGTLIAVLLLEYVSGRVRNEDDLEDAAQVACLGVVDGLRSQSQAEGDLVVESSPQSRTAASYRLLAAKIESAGNGARPVFSVLVLGAEEAQGSGELAVNLAATLARSGRRVTVVDANRAEGEVTGLFGLDHEPGIGEWLQAKAPRRPSLSQRNGLSVLARGMAASDRVESSQAAGLLSALLDGTDLVVLNAAPLTSSPSAMAWAKTVDATLLVAQRGVTRRESVSGAAESLRLAGANVIGAVLARDADPWWMLRFGSSRAAQEHRSPGSEPRVLDLAETNGDRGEQPARWH